MSDKLIILEDLERSGINIRQVLGYVNNLVEQDGAKVLLVANEKEIKHLEQIKTSISALIMTISGMKNKSAINTLWESLKKKIKKGSLYSAKWFENASLEELEKAREVVRLDYVNPNLDLDYRNQCWNLLSRFDRAIRKITRSGKAIGYPVHSSHGWHLPSDD